VIFRSRSPRSQLSFSGRPRRGLSGLPLLNAEADPSFRPQGTRAAVAQYKDPRKQYFGAQAYDFSEGSLVRYAQRAKNDTAAAIKNLEKAVELDA
jgi:hypothetical protein